MNQKGIDLEVVVFKNKLTKKKKKKKFSITIYC